MVGPAGHGGSYDGDVLGDVGAGGAFLGGREEVGRGDAQAGEQHRAASRSAAVGAAPGAVFWMIVQAHRRVRWAGAGRGPCPALRVGRTGSLAICVTCSDTMAS
jgi:hypothetical protein